MEKRPKYRTTEELCKAADALRPQVAKNIREVRESIADLEGIRLEWYECRYNLCPEPSLN